MRGGSSVGYAPSKFCSTPVCMSALGCHQLTDLQDRIGARFTQGVTCNSVTNQLSLCPISDTACLAGETSIFALPCACCHTHLLSGYLRDKSSDSMHTSACIITPCHLSTCSELGLTPLCTVDLHGHRMQVWYDPPCAPVSCHVNSSSSLDMTFASSIAGANGKILMDSGASHVFITDAFCAKHSIRVHPTRHVAAHVPGGTTTPITGQVRVRSEERRVGKEC